MTDQPTQDPFEPYRPGPSGGEQPHPQGAPPPPPPWARPTGPYAQSPYSYGSGYQAQQVHPQASLVLVLGILGVFFSLVAPVAWVLGARAKKEIEASGGRLGGLSQVTVGYVLGIVMTVVMALVVLLVVVFFAVVLIAVAAGS